MRASSVKISTCSIYDRLTSKVYHCVALREDNTNSNPNSNPNPNNNHNQL